MTLTIRPEEERDHRAIYDLTAIAFAPMPYADGDEQDVIDRLRDAGALTLSLVAEQDGAIIGQVTFSPAQAQDGGPGWYTLGPVSVEPGCQKQGIGGLLIRAGLDRLTTMGADGCILVGNPTYYSRFGFAPAPEHAPKDGHEVFFQLLALSDAQPKGIFGFHPAFAG